MGCHLYADNTTHSHFVDLINELIINISNFQNGQICGCRNPETGSINRQNRSFYKHVICPRFAEKSETEQKLYWRVNLSPPPNNRSNISSIKELLSLGSQSILPDFRPWFLSVKGGAGPFPRLFGPWGKILLGQAWQKPLNDLLPCMTYSGQVLATV